MFIKWNRPCDHTHQFFRTNFLITDFVEAWVITSSVGYSGRVRFTIDIAIATLLLFAVMASSSSTYITFLMLAAVLLLGAAWSLVLNYELDGPDRRYPRTIIGTHVAAAVWILWFFYTSTYDFVEGRFDFTRTYANDMHLAISIWVLYVIISIVMFWFKKWWRQPDIVFDLLPVAIVIRLTEWTIRAALFLLVVMFIAILQYFKIENRRLQVWKQSLQKEKDTPVE